MNRHNMAVPHFIGIYTIGLLSSISAAIVYLTYIWLSQKEPSPEQLAFICIAGALHWLPSTITAYATMSTTTLPHPLHFATSLAMAYFAHGSVLTLLTGITTRLLATQETNSSFNIWLSHRITIACHLRFANLLSGTEAFCVYLRFLGAQIGKHCSIRAINPVADPHMVSLGAGVHLGDFCRFIFLRIHDYFYDFGLGVLTLKSSLLSSHNLEVYRMHSHKFVFLRQLVKTYFFSLTW